MKFLCLRYSQESGPTLQIAPPSVAQFSLQHHFKPEKNKNNIFLITIGFLAPLVLGNVSRSPRAGPLMD